jgi:DNA repair exonuclease SbcCD ATPase subunit
LTAAATTLRDLVIERLDKDTKPEDEWSALVLAALEGQAELDKLLNEANSNPAGQSAHKEEQIQGLPSAAPPRIAFFRSISVEGFRGIGPKATLDLTPGPGLTLVVGRNGSGKSSFAEALELLLTGETYRFENRSKVWREGWRNLHHKTARVTAEFALEGEKGPCTVAREWADGAELDAATAWAQVHGKPRGAKEALGWETPLQNLRPFLSYNELGSLLDEGPSKLYDALSKVLGLDALVDAQAALQQERAMREKAQKDADQERKAILAKLEAPTDERAAKAKAALVKKDWDLDDVESLLTGARASREQEGEIALLRRLAVFQAPDEAALQEAVKSLRDAAARQIAAAQTVAGKSDAVASLIDHALRFHQAHGDGACPVCGREKALDKTWHDAKSKEAESLKQAAREATDARTQLKAALAAATKLVSLDRDLLKKAQAAHVPQAADVLSHLESMNSAGEDSASAATALADAIEKAGSPMVTSVDQLRKTAAQQLASKEDAWRPHATALAEWLPKARKAKAQSEAQSNLKAAEKWLKDAAEAIRNERFAPIADHARRIWDRLKLQSNVSLESVQLGGTGKARKVELRVTVDGQQGAALGVMSQGELHSLALSLFIPRATLKESPFRFVVIDDPVQSMDPARVDGLARVLQEASQDRQVVVFTHDDRLPEAVRRLNVKATVVEVTRKEGSLVATRVSKDPVSRYLDDAFALASTSELPPEVACRVVPGLCRHAIEAACMEAVRRRRIGRGEPHSGVEALLAGITGARPLVALALFDDKERAGEVTARLNKESRGAADTLRAVIEGAHEALNGDILTVVRNTEKLSRWMQALA